MHESLFNNKITLCTSSGLSPVKVDIVKTESGVEIRLIDTSNLFSLWTYNLTSSDFYLLKKDQDILVDYDRFIHVLINLFHGAASSRYSASFNDGVLRFIENTEFRNICKLELKFCKPDESHYRRYLGDLIARMENDNIKLIKENAVLRDRCMSGDQAQREKMKFVECDNAELRRRLEIIQKEFGSMQESVAQKENEISKLSGRMYSIDNENSQLRYEVEKYQRENSTTLREQVKNKEEELEELSKELSTANEIIKKLRQENNELKHFKNENVTTTQKEAQRNEELNSKLEELVKKLAQTEVKYKKLKEEAKERTRKIEELNEINRTLNKRLENAQNVYNHFYSKRVEDHPDNLSDTFSLRPESPPGR
ncbi:hypothetical protein GINT2_001910 [Glugoides intestinalis]